MRSGKVLSLERLGTPAGFVAIAGLCFLAALAVAERQYALAVAVASAPLAVVLAAALKDQPVVLLLALGWGMVGGLADQVVPLSESVLVYPADLILGLALLSWLLGRRSEVSAQRLWPFWIAFVPFAAAVLAATVRGHESYGASLVSQPLRLVLYAAVAAMVLRTDPGRLYKGITVVFYSLTVWQFFTALYHITGGTSQTTSYLLSTGGSRFLSLPVSLYLAGALFLALLNLGAELSTRRRVLHGTIVVLALFGIVVSYGRGTFAAVAIGIVVLAAVSAELRRTLVRLSPLLLAVMVSAGFITARALPEVASTLTSRVNPAVSQDVTVRWRQEANRAIWRQVREDPVFGVGFGRRESFAVGGGRYNIPQNPHNDYIYLLAGAGSVALGSLLVMYLLSFREVWRVFRRAPSPRERALILWIGVTLFAFLLNGLAEPLLTFPSVLLTVWVLLLLPFSIGAHMDAEAEG